MSRGPALADLSVMLWALTILLMFLWVLGAATSSPLGAWLHLMLALAVVGLAVNLTRRPFST